MTDQPHHHPYQLAARRGADHTTIVTVGDQADRAVNVGGDNVTIIAGPCAVESRESLYETAAGLRQMGVRLLRGGAFKPRTSPHSFQGLGEAGLRILREVADELDMLVVTEVLGVEEVPLVAQYADMVQVGTRNMANVRLLQRLGRERVPVLLKRGMGSTIEEFLCAAEYILHEGNERVVLCERGIRSFEPLTRAAFDLNVVPLIAQLTHLPLIVDPSHASGRRELVGAVSIGAVAAGAHGLLVEVHHDPEASIVDGRQSLGLDDARRLVTSLQTIADATGRQLRGADARVAA